VANATHFPFFMVASENFFPGGIGSFPAARHSENLEIHKVFLRFPLLDLLKNPSIPDRK